MIQKLYFSFLFLFSTVPLFAAIDSYKEFEILDSAEIVRIAAEKNPLVLQAKSQYESALHQIKQVFTPQDPFFTYGAIQSPAGFSNPSIESLGVSESFQFPSKSWLQGDNAHRTAEIARLNYLAVLRDSRSQSLTLYYQTLLDSATLHATIENRDSLSQILEVVQVAYSANSAAQSDLVGAELALIQSSQSVRTAQIAEQNDSAALNQILGRDPRNPIHLKWELYVSSSPFQNSLDSLIEKGISFRQEILEAAINEKNAKTSLHLAALELLPDFTVAYTQNHYWAATAAPVPEPNNMRDNSITFSFNLPLFFWFKQKEDIQSAEKLLENARNNRQWIELQTKTNISQIYRTTQFALDTVTLNKDLMIPLATQNFRVALTAYQSQKVDFLTLSNALQGVYNARINALIAMNQYLAGRVALEQSIGAPIP